MRSCQQGVICGACGAVIQLNHCTGMEDDIDIWVDYGMKTNSAFLMIEIYI